MWVVEDGAMLPDPFIDLRDEINGQWDRGLIGFALDPDFLVNRHAYLLYTVDPVYGPPDEDPDLAATQRVTRYTGTVKSIKDFGAFVEIKPGTEGLLHISQLEDKRVDKVTDVVKEGEQVMVKILDVDRQGKIKLSRKDALGQKPTSREH